MTEECELFCFEYVCRDKANAEEYAEKHEQHTHDFCIAAFEAGKKIAKDGVGFSLIGAGGIQFNITE